MSEIEDKGASVVAANWGVEVRMMGQELEVLDATTKMESLAHPILLVASSELTGLTTANQELSAAVKEQTAITELIKLFGVPEDLLVRPAFMELAKHEVRIRQELSVAARHAQELASRVYDAMRDELNRSVMQELKNVREQIALHKSKKLASQQEAAGLESMSGLNQKNNAEFDIELAKLKDEEILLESLAIEIGRSMMTLGRSHAILSQASAQSIAPVTAKGLMFAN